MKFKKIPIYLLILILTISLITSTNAQKTIQNEDTFITIPNNKVSKTIQDKPVAEHVQYLINQLNNSESGKLPVGFTKEDMKLVIREGGQAGLDAVKKALSNGYAIDISSDDDILSYDAYKSNDKHYENHSYQYDPSTGQIIFID